MVTGRQLFHRRFQCQVGGVLFSLFLLEFTKVIWIKLLRGAIEIHWKVEWIHDLPYLDTSYNERHSKLSFESPCWLLCKQCQISVIDGYSSSLRLNECQICVKWVYQMSVKWVSNECQHVSNRSYNSGMR